VFLVNRFSKFTRAAAVAVLLAGFGLTGFGIGRASAQSGGLNGTDGLLRADGLGGAFDESAGDLVVHASILPPAGGRPAQLSIAIDIPEGWHTYSITQPAGGPNRTLIKLDPSDEFKLGGNYTVDPAPHVHTDEAFPGVPQEEHTGHVTWTAPLAFRQGVDLSHLKISGVVNAQRCSTGCLAPKDFKFTAMLVGAPVVVTRVIPASPDAAIPAAEVPAAVPKSEPAVEQAKWEVYQYQAKNSAAIVHGWVEPSFAAPGSTARLVLSIAPGPQAHVYALADRETNGLGKPTLIALGKTPHWTFDRPRPDRAPVEETTDVGALSIYNAPVTWIVDIHVPHDAAGNYPVEGILGYQACTAEHCEFQQGVRFKGEVVVTPDRSLQANDVRPLSFLPVVYREAAEAAQKSSDGVGSPQAPAASPTAPALATSPFLRQLHPKIKGTEPTNLATVILFGLLGGLILNLMPCVLPVIGLKILGFVEQGGQSRARTLVLNIWYSLGLLLVFMVLAAVAVNLHLKWGQQFQSSAFVIVMCGVVFVMALSFLGVWEIPIPGFVGSGKSAKLAAKEGAAGAFAKGVLTTVLATPCSGPYLGAVFSYALTQSPLVTYIVFASIGLGMASPYLLIGAFPALIRFLPKPGMWMETFKQFMGFILLATVVYLFSLLDKDLFVPVLALIVGLWAACWWIGRTPLTADLGRKLKAWGIGAVVAAAVGWFSLAVLVPHPELPHPAELDWQPYSEARLDQLLGEGKTVMVDFTASWCLTCRLNSLHALNTLPVKQFVQKNGVVSLLADKSHSSPEIDQMLDALHSNTIPVLAIFPAEHPHEPIVLRDLVSQSGVVEALQEAGPSRSGLAAAEAPAR
jgi:thiol:disulfide interchange protein